MTSMANHLTAVPEAYDYDQIYQLTEVLQDLNGTPTTTEAYTYDDVGNRLSTLSDSGWTYNNSNHLTARPGVTYSYDNNGNTTSKVDAGGTTSYSWNMADQLTSVTLPNSGGTVSFNYDVFGRRVRKVAPSGTTIYLYDGANIIAELDASGNVLARYTQGPGIDEPLAMLRGGTVSFYHADGLGSVTSLTDGIGSPAGTYTYDAFGQLVASSGSLATPFRYTGREWDGEIGTYHYRARYFDQASGRFVSEDPLRFAASMNFYAYVENNPTIFVDPSGLHRLHYDGAHIYLYGDKEELLLKCRATSGVPNSTPEDQTRPWQGPIPEGTYSLYPNQFSGGPIRSRIRPGDWGTWRVPLHPVDRTETHGRSGFFLHGGRTPGSAGCIDVGDCDVRIRNILSNLSNHPRWIPVTVRYDNFLPF